MGRLAIVLKSKTFWGSILGAGAWLLNQPHVSPVDILQAVGGVVAAVGLRDAVGKVQTGNAEPPQIPPTPKS